MTSTFLRLALSPASRRLWGFAPILVSGGPAPHPDLCRRWGVATSRWRQQEPPVTPSGGKAAVQVHNPLSVSAEPREWIRAPGQGAPLPRGRRGAREQGLRRRGAEGQDGEAQGGSRVDVCAHVCVRVPCTTAGLPVPVDVEDAGVDRLEGAGACVCACAPA